MNELTDAQIKSLDCVYLDSDEHGTQHYIVQSSVMQFARAVIAAHEAQRQAEPAQSNNYVQTVPDQCDRIVWRNAYYHLASLIVARQNEPLPKARFDGGFPVEWDTCIADGTYTLTLA